LATSEIIRTSNPDINIVNILMAEKLGFTSKDYNFYLNNYYYDYSKNSNNIYALKLIRIDGMIIFI